MKVVATLEDTQRLNLRENKLEFSSSDETVAIVDEFGQLTAIGSGLATITVSVAYHGVTKKRNCPVAVK